MVACPLQQCFAPSALKTPHLHVWALRTTALVDLTNAWLQVEAFMFGSVPLKTYLPDGDIDLSVFQSKGASLQDSWTTKLCHALQAEGRNCQAPYRVRDVQVIHAEVRQCCSHCGHALAGQC